MRVFVVIHVIVFFAVRCVNAHAQPGTNSGAVLTSQFTAEVLKIDGAIDSQWESAKPVILEKAMTADLSTPALNCVTRGVARSLWDGALLYLLVQVNDNNISNSAQKLSDQDGVEIYVDLWNDKYPKYEEDDGVLFVSAKGEKLIRGTDGSRFEAMGSKPIYNSEGRQIGYTVEMAFHLGGIPVDNGSTIGLELGINDAIAESNSLKHRIFWSSARNNGLNDNSNWGTVVLSGYDGKSVRAVDYFSLTTNIQKAEALPSGIWQNEETLTQSLLAAKNALNQKDQAQIDQSARTLEKAIKSLRRKGPYPDPFDLPAVSHLPDPFAFRNGSKVKNAADWEKRAEEIKALAQYYEYGKMPPAPEKVTATLTDRKLVITVEDSGRKVEFEAQLTIPKLSPNANRNNLPVIVGIDFFVRDADTVYLNAGYAVLSFRYTDVASDNNEHTGPFYDLYPYNVKTGNDAGTLLAWAWGAMRCVDALEYLSEQDAGIGQRLDLSKVVVTGFSRCGKAALAAGLFDKRFGVVSPGASGCGGAAVYRYVSFGNTPKRKAPFGNEYAWGKSPGCEVLGDKIRHQGHNSNEMLARFLPHGRIYKTSTNGYGERLPYDHHEIIAAIAPRAVLVTTATDDYPNNAEGDAIGVAGARPVFEFLGVPEKLGFNLRTTGEANPRGFGGGHWLSVQQIRNLIQFSNKVFYAIPLPKELESNIYANPYVPTFDKYYGGKKEMMPWLYTGSHR